MRSWLGRIGAVMEHRPRLHVYGGVGTIGGTKIAVQEDDDRVLFDFGLAFASGGDFWSDRLRPRPGPGRLRDLIGLGYVPALDGLYRPGEAEAAGLQPGRDDDRTHVFLSHLHLDHMAAVDLLADTVPVWMHTDSLRLFRAVAESGEPPAVPEGVRAFDWGQTVAVGPVRVTPLPVDHDVPGASGLLIETSAGTVVYTGDFRMHGAHPERMEAFIEAARRARPRILLIEGTRLGQVEPNPDDPPTLPEREVPGRVAEYCAEAQGLALITLYPRNTPRIGGIAVAARKAGRTLVLSPEAAHLYAAMGGDLRGVAVYRRERDRQALASGTAPAWLRRLLEGEGEVLDATAIRAQQDRFLLQLFFPDLPELVDLQPVRGSVFIHSNGEPLGRFDPAYDLMLRWLDRFGLELLHASSTGHAGHDELLRVVEAIRPEILMPIHSRTPELMEVPTVRRVLPETGAAYDIAAGRRTG